MRIYKTKNDRVNSCSYCRDPRHRATECKTAAYDFVEWSNHRVPIKSPTAGGWMRYDYTRWYKQACRVRSMVIAKESTKKKSRAYYPEGSLQVRFLWRDRPQPKELWRLGLL